MDCIHVVSGKSRKSVEGWKSFDNSAPLLMTHPVWRIRGQKAANIRLCFLLPDLSYFPGCRLLFIFSVLRRTVNLDPITIRVLEEDLLNTIGPDIDLMICARPVGIGDLHFIESLGKRIELRGR